KILRETCPHSFLAHIVTEKEEGMLTDALYTPELQHWLFTNLAKNSIVNLQHSIIHFVANDALKQHIANKGELRSKVHATDFKNTSITYDNSFFLKMFRKLDA